MPDDTPEVAGFDGYAATFWTCDSYGTAFAPGCFARSLAERGAGFPCLWQHNADAPIGRHESIREDGTGLRVNVSLSDDGGEGTMAAARLRDRVPLGMSFGFRTRRDRAAEDDDPLDVASYEALGIPRKEIRIISSVDLFEDSLVTFPANRAARVLSLRRRQSADAVLASMGLNDPPQPVKRRNVKAEFDALFIGLGLPLDILEASRPPLRALPPVSRKEPTTMTIPNRPTPQRVAVRSAHANSGVPAAAPLYDHRALSVPNLVRQVVAPNAPRVVPPGFCFACGDRPLPNERDFVCSECKRDAERPIRDGE